jgi:hypothetical protein
MNRGASSAYQHTAPTLVFAMGICAAAAVIVYQCYCYLLGGAWPTLSVVDGLAWLGIGWSFMPERWINAYQLLKAFPLALAILLLGCGPYLITLLSADRTNRDGSI